MKIVFVGLAVWVALSIGVPLIAIAIVSLQDRYAVPPTTVVPLPPEIDVVTVHGEGSTLYGALMEHVRSSRP